MTSPLLPNIAGFIALWLVAGCTSAPTGASSSGRLPDVPLVVGGERSSSDFDGTLYETVNGNPEVILAGAPNLCAAHIAIVPSSSVTAQFSSCSAGNLPDKFVWHGDFGYVVNGKALKIQITIDGRTHTFAAARKRFQLAQGNYFRLTILPGPAIETVHIPVVDVLENDPEKTKAVFTAHPREPVYKGKPLSYWLEPAAASQWTGDNSLAQQKANEAVCHTGTNAIPMLLQMLRRTDSDLEINLHRFARNRHLNSIDRLEAVCWNQQAAEGFRVLGARARDAVPALIQIYQERISDVSQSRAAWALGFIGPDARAAIPSLLRTLADTNFDHAQMRMDAIIILGRIHQEPRAVVPALAKALHDSEVSAGMVIETLGEFGPDAKSAVPAILEYMRTKDHPEDSLVVTEALKTIDPEAASQWLASEEDKDSDSNSQEWRIFKDRWPCDQRLGFAWHEDKQEFLGDAVLVTGIADRYALRLILNFEASFDCQNVHFTALRVHFSEVASVVPSSGGGFLIGYNTVSDQWFGLQKLRILRSASWDFSKIGITIISNAPVENFREILPRL